MKQYIILALLLLAMLTSCTVWAQSTAPEDTTAPKTTPVDTTMEEPATTPRAPRASMLPDISVIGDVKGTLSDPDNFDEYHLQLNEIEVVFGGNIYPGIRGDLVLAAHGPEFTPEVEEGYATIHQFTPSLPLGGRLGIVRLPFGKESPLHPHQLPTTDYPNVITNLLGDEFIGNGFEAMVTPASDSFFLNFQLGRWSLREHHHHEEEEAGEEEEEHHHHTGAGFTDTFTLGRLWTGTNLGTEREIELGISGAIGNGTHQHYDEDGNPTHAHATDITLYGGDITYRRWFPGGGRFLLQGEYIRRQEKVHGTHSQDGWYGLATYRPNNTHELGVRYDWSESPAEEGKFEQYASAFFTHFLNETTYLRLQYTYGEDFNGDTVNKATLQFVFGFGPHAHSMQ